MTTIRTKHIYADAEPGDGYRALVDRLWPRGMSHERAHLDVWLKEVAPTADLRKAFGHDPDHWDEFVTAYTRELDHRDETRAALKTLTDAIARHDVVTLLFAAHDDTENNAHVLRDYLLAHVAGLTTSDAAAS